MTESRIPVRLDPLIDHVLAQHPDGDDLQHLADAVSTAGQVGEVADHLIGHFVDQARRTGASWTEIGQHMGVTKQAVQKRFVPRASEDLDFPNRASLSRFTLRARNTMQKAKSEATDRGHDQVTNEHIVLGLLSEPEGLAAKAIAARASADDIRAAIGSALKSGRKAKPGRVHFSRGAKKTLELGLREALHLGHNYIGTEHLLLGLLRSTDEPATVLLAGFGITHDDVAAWLHPELDRLLAERDVAE